MIEPLIRGEADLVVATGRSPARTATRPRRLTLGGRDSAPARRLTDPLSGLWQWRAGRHRRLEPAPRVRCCARDAARGRRGVGWTWRCTRPRPVSARAGSRSNDLRHLKRLADDRFGNVSRLVQFCMVGASGMVIDLTSYALFQLVFSRTALAA